MNLGLVFRKFVFNIFFFFEIEMGGGREFGDRREEELVTV